MTRLTNITGAAVYFINLITMIIVLFFTYGDMAIGWSVLLLATIVSYIGLAYWGLAKLKTMDDTVIVHQPEQAEDVPTKTSTFH